MKHTIFASLAVSVAFLSSASLVHAANINTGGKNGAYHGQFCPLIKSALTKAQFKYRCKTSKGSRANIRRVTGEPKDIGFAQMDVYALETRLEGAQAIFKTIRSDIARECVFIVSKNKEFTNFGQIAANASKLHFILPPEQSGSTGTFEYLQNIDPQGLGRANTITYAKSTEAALDRVLSGNDKNALTLFVQFPDPNNARFKKVSEAGGRFIPVIDRNILRQEIGGKKIYYAQETQIANSNWIKKGVKVITACTPMVLFTGTPDRISEVNDSKDHKDLIKTLAELPVKQFQPKVGFFSKLWRQSRELSGQGVDKMLEVTEEARKAAGPMMEKAKENAKPMMEKAKELGSKAVEKAGEMTDKVKEGAKEMMKKEN